MDNNRLDIEELNKAPSHKIVELTKMVGLSVKIALKMGMCLPGMVLYGPSAIISKMLANMRRRQYAQVRKWTSAPGTHTDVLASFKQGFFTLMLPFWTLVNFMIIGKGLKPGSKMSQNQSIKLVSMALFLLPVYHEIFKILYDSMGRDHKKLRHTYIKLFKKKLMEEVKKKQEDVMQYVRPML